jgi:hypothetical protein
MKVRMTIRLGAVLLITIPSARGAAVEHACSIPQSPRNIDRQAQPSPYDATSHSSIVKVLTPDTIEYTPRAGGTPTTLSRCGQHYHLPIENLQGCTGEITPGKEPKPGSRIEIHTVYAAKVGHDGCNPETLECCQAEPFLVRAFSAKVAATGPDEPILPPPGLPLAEWSGSTTAPDRVPDECKPAAQWSFRLGCDFSVSAAQLRRFKHADPARHVQHGPRLSKDLTLVTP